MRNRIVIGLTGTFGSGKSSAARILKSLGAHVIDCDQLVREAYQPKAGLQNKILKAVGLKVISREKIADVVFKNSGRRKKLERVIHPYVFKRVAQALEKWKRGVVVIEMPLLFETGFDRKVDQTLVVSTGETDIQKRLGKYGFSKKEIRARWKAQKPLSEKERKADFIIRNSGSFSELKKKVKLFWILTCHSEAEGRRI